MTDIQTTVDVNVTGNVDLTDSLMAQVASLFSNHNFWMFLVSMLATMILMQGVKAVIKQCMHGKAKKSRRWVTFGLAFVIGYTMARFFLHTESGIERNWAVLAGLLNPMIYFFLLQYSRVREKVVMESVLKMRPPVKNEETGKWSVDDTQTFMVQKK